MNDAPIGIFDSGVGGLTVARAVIDQLPNESITYFGDTKNNPYGSKTLPEIRNFSLSAFDQLVESGVKMLIIACNSASSVVLDEARERYATAGIPVIEVIRPAVRRAASSTHNGKIGIIGTQATISSRSYVNAFAAYPEFELSLVACPKFVEFVESGITSGTELLSVANEYLAPIKAAGVDTLILGCTHYPLLTGVLSYVMGEGVTLVSSADEIVKDIYRTLTANDLHHSPQTAPNYDFFVTGNTADFEKLARRFLGPEVNAVLLADQLTQLNLVQTGLNAVKAGNK